MTSSLLRGHHFNIREGARVVTRNNPAKICLFKTTRWNMFKVINKDTDVTQVSFLLTLRILEIIFLNFWNLYFYNFVLTIFYAFIQCFFCWLFFAWKVSKYGFFSGPYFPAFGLNNECGKIRTRKNSVFGHVSRSATLITDLLWN